MLGEVNVMRMKPVIQAACSAVVMGALAVGAASAGEELKVLTGNAAIDKPGEMMTRYLNGLGMAALDRRAEEVGKLKTPEEVKAYQKKMRAFFLKELGPMPERTPLNSEVVGQREFDDYRMEKVIFESRPNFHVTGVLYLPKTEPPYPGVLVPCGHSPVAKAYTNYQQLSVLLARNGMASFCFDPIGQGERFQILDDAGKTVLGGTTEHTQVGVGCILLGTNAANYFVWDGMRAIDYLCGRKDIDAKRIGCTGQSGGGTQTAYLMALDDRIVCAAPSCFITSIRRVWETIAPQDAEQNIHGAVAFGMEHADYLNMRAPKPTMLLTAKEDFFDINGGRATLAEAKKIYEVFGAGDRVAMTESDGPHGINPVLRAASAKWMRRWLLEKDDVVAEKEWEVLKPEELQCTPKGQVLLMSGEKSVFDLNAEYEQKLAVNRNEIWSKAAAEQIEMYRTLGQVCKLAGIRLLDELNEPEVVEAGAVQRGGYKIDKMVIKPEAGIVLPALKFVPDASSKGKEAYLWLNGEGKAADAGAGGVIEKLVKQGHVVLAVDVRGFGETRPEMSNSGMCKAFGPLWADYFRAYMLDKTFVGMRAEDVLVCARYLAIGRMKAGPRRVRLVAKGEAAIPALHAAAAMPKMFDNVELDGCTISWADVVRTPLTRNQLINVVNGALGLYDLPNLMGSLSSDKLTITSLQDATGKPWPVEEKVGEKGK